MAEEAIVKVEEKKELTPSQKIAALLLGRGVRETECSQVIGINISTLWRWKQLRAFQKAVEKSNERRMKVLEAAREEIDEALIEAAKDVKGGSQDRRLYYQLIGKLVERHKDEINVNTPGDLPFDIDNMTDEELEAKRQELLRHFCKNPND